MRAIDILLFCFCVNAALTFVDVSGFGAALTGKETGFMRTANLGSAWAHDLTGMNAFSSPNSAIGGDMFAVAASWVIETMFYAIGFILAAVFVIPVMMDVFYVPSYLAVILQGLLYYVYLWAYIQMKSGRSLYSYW